LFYRVEARHPDGCEATRAVNHNSSRSNRSTSAAPSGEEEEDISVRNRNVGLLELLLYPNPTNDILNISGETEANLFVNLQLIDMQGKVVYTESVHSETGAFRKRVNTASLSQGVYQLRLITEKGVIVKKVVVNK
jgi:hypothetical protein